MYQVLNIAMELPTDKEMLSDPRDDVLALSNYASIPPMIIVWLIDEAQVIKHIRDITLLPMNEIAELHMCYLEQKTNDDQWHQEWPCAVSN